MNVTRAAALALVCVAATVGAQPVNQSDQAARSLGAYVYMMDAAGNKVLVNTQFWRNDPKYDDRVFHRYLDVVSALEKRGFKKDDKATIESWDRPERFARCYIYLEDRQAGRRTKSGETTGSRVWCTDNGISEVEINGSDQPKHLDNVMTKFDEFLGRARANLKK